MRRRRALAAMLAAVAIVLSPARALAQADDMRPEQLFVLGDSLSDVGNAAAAKDFLLGLPIHPASSIGLCNPAEAFLFSRGCDDLFYRQSRVSDGPVAVEYLAAHLRLPDLVPSFHAVPNRPIVGTNYAVASAKAHGSGVENLPHQVDMLMLDHGPLLPADALYVIMIGGNDAIDALQAAVPLQPANPQLPPSQPSAIIAAAVAGVSANVERLIAFGALRLIVADVPDLAALPAVRARAGGTPNEQAALAAASAVSTAFNSELDGVLERIRSEQQSVRPVQIEQFDLHSFLRDELAAAAESGRNVLDACFDSEAYLASSTAERVFHPDCAPEAGAPRFGNFFFWDGIHPTGTAHAAIGAALIELYESRARTSASR